MLTITIIIILIILLSFSIFTVEQQTFKIVERFGKFNSIRSAGLNFKIPFVDWIAGKDTFRIQQLNVPVETKTKDNVFINIKVSVQYHIIKEKAYDSFYKLENAEPQIKSYVFDVVRANVPTLDLDDVFEKKEEIAKAVKQELKETMDDFGYLIIQALITNIDPDKNVKNAMNEINAQRRLKIAAAEKGEADKILIVKAAEAESESKKLQGEGIAKQRKAIVEGLKESVHDFSEAVEGSSPQDVMTLVLMTQYFDTLKDVGGSSKSNVVMIPSSPAGMDNIWKEILKSITVGSKIQNS